MSENQQAANWMPACLVASLGQTTMGIRAALNIHGGWILTMDVERELIDPHYAENAVGHRRDRQCALR